MTIDITQFSEQMLEQASAWIVRLRSDQATEQDRQDFALWLSESPHHQAAFDEMLVLWEAMGSGAAVSDGQSTITALMGQVSAHNGPNACNDGATAAEAVTATAHSPWLASFAAMAASLLIVGLVFFAGYQPARQPITSSPQTLYATPVGNQQRFTLEDGSVIELNTDSRVAVRYDEHSRNLTLLDGEAYFEVKPDPDKPFVVSAGAGKVTALGTAFNIQLSPGGTPAGSMVVAVTEGHVAVSDANRQSAQPVSVNLGQQTSVSESGQIGAVQAADLTLVSAWREKTLIFRSTELASALDELNRYLPQPVDTSDPSLQRLTVSGTFSLEEPEVTLNAIVDAFELESYRNPFDNKRRLYRR